MDMSAYELSILVYESATTIDNTFETWLAATFAVVVTSYAAGNRLSIFIKLFIGSLYVVATLFLFARYSHTINYTIQYFEALAKLGDSAGEVETVASIANVRKFVIGLGTIGALIFLFFPSLSVKGTRGGKADRLSAETDPDS